MLLIDVPLIAMAVYLDHPEFFRGHLESGRDWESLYAVIVASLVLLVRWRWPMTAFLINLAHLTAASVLGAWHFGLLLLIALHAAARQSDRRVSIAAALACAIPFGIATYEWSADGFPAHILGGTVAGLTVSAWILGYWMQRAVQEQMTAKAVAHARRAERVQLARELHEIITRSVDVMRDEAAIARKALAGDPGRAARALEAVQEDGTRAMAELRRMLSVMRLSAQDEPDGHRTRRVGVRLLLDSALVATTCYIDWYVWLGQVRPMGNEKVYFFYAAVMLALLLRWRWPLAVMALHLAFAVAILEVRPDSDYIVGPLIALHAVSRLLDRRVSIQTAFVCTAPYALLFHRQGGNFSDPVDVAVTAAMCTVIVTMPWLLGYSMRRAAEGKAAARAAARERRAERLQLAHELHDIVSHTVTMMLLQAAGARAVLSSDPTRAEAAVDAIREAGDRSMTELAHLLTLITPDGAAPPAQHPGLEALNELLSHMRTTGLSVTIETTGTPADLDPSVNLTAYRIIQEALTNSTKYAGPDATAHVRLTWTDSELGIDVTDHHTGKRGTVPSTGHGLIGLQERLNAIGGDFTAGPHHDGFAVTATLPLAPAPAWPSPSDRTTISDRTGTESRPARRRH
ncbi:sensor histidine kinase [Paractinoplanes rishiriensis]|uniref:sensor histidine kinase n=1 Tax=Paractinoplanes rishiriensis TaxID=1050105 RepID=UPI0019434463|nr:histidine kinase [Actinoplanes rishiriensis]